MHMGKTKGNKMRWADKVMLFYPYIAKKKPYIQTL